MHCILYGANHVVCALADLWESPYSFLLAVDLVYSRSTSGDDASARLSRFSKKGSGFLCATAKQKDWGLRVNELSSDGVMIASIIVWYARVCFCGTPCRCKILLIEHKFGPRRLSCWWRCIRHRPQLSTNQSHLLTHNNSNNLWKICISFRSCIIF